MNFKTALTRFRLNPLRDSVRPYLWDNDELQTYFNEIRDEFCEETQSLIDSETPEICQIIAGVVAANLERGTNAATIKVVTAFDFMNIGTKYTFPITDNIAMTACSVQAVSTFCRYLICADSENAVTVQKGDDSSTAAAAYLPLMTEDLTPIGMLLIQTGAGNTFTSGTTSLNSAGITATFVSSSETFALDSRVVRLNSAEMSNIHDGELDIKDKHWMNRHISSWKTRVSAIPQGLISGEMTGQYRIWPPPLYPEQILLTVARRPLADLSSMTSLMEIPDEYVKRLYNGVAQLAYMKRDAKTLDATKAAEHGDKWLNDIEMVKRDIIRKNATNDNNYLPGGVLP